MITRPGANHAVPTWWPVVGLLLVAMLYAGRIRISPIASVIANDSPSYVVLAKSLAQGQGLRAISGPDEPLSLKFPVGYPWVLSLIVRHFGVTSNAFTAMRVVSAVAMLFWVSLLPRFFLGYMQPRTALIGALVVGVCPLVFWMAGEIMAEALFSLAVLLALLASQKSLNIGNTSAGIAFAFLAGALASASLLLRTIGVAVVMGIAITLLIRGRDRRCFAALFGCASVALPWIIWSMVHQGGSFSTYNQENKKPIYFPAVQLAAITCTQAADIALPPLSTNFMRLHLGNGATIIVHVVVGLPISILTLVGLIRLLRNTDVVGWTSLSYLLIILSWWFVQDRFLQPIIPLLMVNFCVGVRATSVYMRMAGCRGAIMAIWFAASIAVSGMRSEKIFKYGSWDGAEGQRSCNELAESWAWVRANTPANTIIVTNQPALTYLFANRKTVVQSDASGRLEQLAAYPDRPSAILASNDPFIVQNLFGNYGLAGVEAFAAAHPDQIVQAYQSSGGLVRIYQFIAGGHSISRDQELR